MTFYTYLWLREDGSPYYVGKGSGNRAFKKRRIGNPPPERVVLTFWPNEAEAFTAEIALIAHFGRIDQGTGCLRNLTDGGDNPPNHKGMKRSAEWLLKQSIKKKGRSTGKQSANTRHKRRLAMIGRTFSSESIERMRKAQLGKHCSAETKVKLRMSHKDMHKGIPWSAARRKANTPESVEKMRQAHLGKYHSEESRAKMRFSQKERRKAEAGRK